MSYRITLEKIFFEDPQLEKEEQDIVLLMKMEFQALAQLQLGRTHQSHGHYLSSFSR